MTVRATVIIVIRRPETHMPQRISIDVPGLDHVNPVPSASRLGPLLITSGVSGRDPSTGKFPETIEAQCANMFASLRLMLELAGAKPDDAIRISVWLKDLSHRPHLNHEWLVMFPDAASRPALHTLPNPLLDPPMLIQCDCLAVLGAG